MARVSFENDAEKIRERHYISYHGPIEIESGHVDFRISSSKYRWEVTFKFHQKVDREVSYNRKKFHNTRNLRIYLTDENTMCDFYVDQDSIIVLFPKKICPNGITTLIFEWYEVAVAQRLWWNRFFFPFEIYGHTYEFFEYPEQTEVYVAHPPVSWIYRLIDGKFIPGLDWEIKSTPSPKTITPSPKTITPSPKTTTPPTKMPEVGKPYNAGEELVWRSKLYKLQNNEKAVLKIKYGSNDSVRNWVTLGAIFALLALSSINIVIFAMPEDPNNPSKKFETIGTIGAAGFATLLAIRTWFYADEIRITGLIIMKRIYTYLSSALIGNIILYHIIYFEGNTMFSLINNAIKAVHI